MQASLAINNVNYSINDWHYIDGFKVGDTLTYWPQISGQGNGDLYATLTVSVVGGPPVVPEPGAASLLAAGGLVLGGLRLRRKHK